MGNSSCQPYESYNSTSTKHCKKSNGTSCCQAGKSYPLCKCSPPVTNNTPGILTLNDFGKSGDGGGATACDGKYHSDDDLIVALSTGWFNNKTRCNMKIKITAKNGKSASAMVVDECDSTVGCDKEHDYQPPCPYNDVDASKAVWKALGLDTGRGNASITWSDV
ncbi:hypothetical protein LUZ60_014838 [Juncus effusus]|nr:hypothetical protein LUZ60_014838 [Juncus effusus]